MIPCSTPNLHTSHTYTNEYGVSVFCNGVPFSNVPDDPDPESQPDEHEPLYLGHPAMYWIAQAYMDRDMDGRLDRLTREALERIHNKEPDA